MIVPYFRVKKVISVSDRAAAYSLLRHNQGFVVGSGYHSTDKSYKDILAVPLYQGMKLEVGWIVKDKFLLSEIAERFIEHILQTDTK